jgi:hypothetical protein
VFDEKWCKVLRNLVKKIQGRLKDVEEANQE